MSFSPHGITDAEFEQGHLLTKLAPKRLQAIYIAYTLCLQGEWQYLCRCMPDIFSLMETLKQAVREKLIPAFLGIGTANVTHTFCELPACMVRIGGMSLRNSMEMAETYFDTSTSVCSYLVKLLVKEGKFSQTTHIINVLWLAKNARVA